MLGEVKIDLAAMKTEVRRLDRDAIANKVTLTQCITTIQHKIDAALNDRTTAHELLQRRLSTAETTLTNWDSLNAGFTSLGTDLAQMEAVQGELMTIVQGMISNLDDLMNLVEPETMTPAAVDEEEVVADLVSSRAGQRTLAPLVEDEKE